MVGGVFVVVSKEGSDIYIHYIIYICIHIYIYLRIIPQYLLPVVVHVESVGHRICEVSIFFKG